MGVVYRAQDPRIDRLVAIKTISLAGQEPADEHEYRQRFLEEARAAGRLSHPGIVAVFDAGEDPETHESYLVMEYVAGKPLSIAMAENGGRLPLATALGFAYEVAEALDYAHRQGVIHRDIKPSNILIGEDGHAKIADFGVARINRATTTTSGQLVGSPAYMAPEQLAGGPVDARSDLFSLGVVLYSMVTGFRPFQGNSAQTVCFKVLNVEPVPVTSFQTELPAAIDRIVSKAIAKDPAERYQDGAELARDIQDLIRGDALIAEATAFFTRGVPREGIPARKDRKHAVRRVLWEAAVVALMAVWGLTGWHIHEAYTQAAEIQPPSVPLPTVPVEAMLRTPIPRVVHAIYHKKPKPLPEPETTPIIATAKIRVEILHHFSGGEASIWMDNQLVVDQPLRTDDQRHPIFRTVEMNQVTSLEFTPGKHDLRVRVVTPDATYDQTETLAIDLVSKRQHVLLINCDKRKMQVSLQ